MPFRLEAKSRQAFAPCFGRQENCASKLRINSQTSTMNGVVWAKPHKEKGDSNVQDTDHLRIVSNIDVDVGGASG